MTANTLEELFEERLKKVYYAEQQFVDALEVLESGSQDEQVKEAFNKILYVSPT